MSEPNAVPEHVCVILTAHPVRPPLQPPCPHARREGGPRVPSPRRVSESRGRSHPSLLLQLEVGVPKHGLMSLLLLRVF